MEENKKKQEKLSYEELQKVAGELSQQNQKLMQYVKQLQDALQKRDFDYTSFFLSMLFKVMEHPEMYSDKFVKWVSESVEEALTSFADAQQKAVEEKEKTNEAE